MIGGSRGIPPLSVRPVFELASGGEAQQSNEDYVPVGRKLRFAVDHREGCRVDVRRRNVTTSELHTSGSPKLAPSRSCSRAVFRGRNSRVPHRPANSRQQPHSQTSPRHLQSSVMGCTTAQDAAPTCSKEQCICTCRITSGLRCTCLIATAATTQVSLTHAVEAETRSAVF